MEAGKSWEGQEQALCCSRTDASRKVEDTWGRMESVRWVEGHLNEKKNQRRRGVGGVGVVGETGRGVVAAVAAVVVVVVVVVVAAAERRRGSDWNDPLLMV